MIVFMRSFAVSSTEAISFSVLYDKYLRTILGLHRQKKGTTLYSPDAPKNYERLIEIVTLIDPNWSSRKYMNFMCNIVSMNQATTNQIVSRKMQMPRCGKISKCRESKNLLQKRRINKNFISAKRS